MEQYTASNGITVRLDDGDLDIKHPNAEWVALRGTYVVDALREFFRAEEDERLGRWRFNDHLVVYPKVQNIGQVRGRGCLVLDERQPRVYDRWENPTTTMVDFTEVGNAAHAYFEAHPEPKPIPNEPRSAWVDKYGTDVWVVGGDGVLRCVSSPSSDPAKYAPFTRLVPEVSQ